MFYYPITRDLELRLLVPYHAVELYALIDANRDHLRRWMGWVDSVTCVADVQASRRNNLHSFAENGCFEAGIWHQGRLAGVIAVQSIDWTIGSTTIGYWLAASAQGQGLMTQACRAVLPHLFDTLELHRVEIRAATGNAASRAIPERLGFRHETTLPNAEQLPHGLVDLEVYTLLREEWAAQRG